MSITKIGPERQITIPEEIFETLELVDGDQVEVQAREGVIYLIPQKLIPEDQSWFWTEEWQAKEREADEAVARGELSGPFESAAELTRHLQGQK